MIKIIFPFVIVKTTIKQLCWIVVVVAGIFYLCGCAVCSVDSLGNRKYSGFMWTKQGTVDEGRANVVLIKSLGLEVATCYTGVGIMFGYKSRLLTWPSLLIDPVSKKELTNYGIDAPPKKGKVGFISLIVPAHKEALLYEASQFGASLSSCSEYPVIGLGYQSKTQVEYARNGKAYCLKYASGKPDDIMFHEINPEEYPQINAIVITR